MKKNNLFKKGFTLVELVVVIAVIAILAAVSVGAYFGVTEQAKRNRLEQEVKQVHTALQTVSLVNNNHSSLTKDGLKITSSYLFENKLEENLASNISLTNESEVKDIDNHTICLSTSSLSNKLEDFTYKTIEYHNYEIDGIKALVDIVTGEIKIVNSSAVKLDILDQVNDNTNDNKDNEESEDDGNLTPPEPNITGFTVILENDITTQYRDGDTFILPNDIKFVLNLSDDSTINLDVENVSYESTLVKGQDKVYFSYESFTDYVDIPTVLDPLPEKVSLYFDNTSKRTIDGDSHIWRENGIVFTNSRGDGPSIDTRINPIYINTRSLMKIEAEAPIVKISFTCNGSGNASDLKYTLGSEASYSGKYLFFVPTIPSQSFSWYIRIAFDLEAITVYYK